VTSNPSTGTTTGVLTYTLLPATQAAGLLGVSSTQHLMTLYSPQVNTPSTNLFVAFTSLSCATSSQSANPSVGGFVVSAGCQSSVVGSYGTWSSCPWPACTVYLTYSYYPSVNLLSVFAPLMVAAASVIGYAGVSIGGSQLGSDQLAIVFLGGVLAAGGLIAVYLERK